LTKDYAANLPTHFDSIALIGKVNVLLKYSPDCFWFVPTGILPCGILEAIRENLNVEGDFFEQRKCCWN
jgi:hypothetical protein